MLNKKFETLMKDQEFIKELVNKETMEEAKKLFGDKGVEISDEELTTVGKLLNKIKEKFEKVQTKGEKVELTEDDLKEVVGAGSDAELTGKIIGGIIGCSIGASAGLAASNGVAALTGIDKCESKVGRGAYATGAIVSGAAGEIFGGALGVKAGGKIVRWFEKKFSK